MTDATPLGQALKFQSEHASLMDVLPTVASAWGVHSPGEAQDSRAGRAVLADYLSLRPRQQVLVVLIDGMGYDLVLEHLAYARFLRSRRFDILQGATIIPSTTAAAITAFGTGRPPGQTRMVGWSVKDQGRITTLLSFEGASEAPEVWQPQSTWFEILRAEGVDSAAVSTGKFANSGLTRAALRGTRHVGAESLDERISAAMAELAQGTPVVYLYWSELDHAGHGAGSGSQEWIHEFEVVDAGLERIARELPAGVAGIVTADHGMICTSADTRIDVANTPELKEGLDTIAGEGRNVHIHVQPGHDADAVLDRWEAFLGDRATIVRGGEVANVLGGEDGARLVGDAMALMHGNWVVVDSRTQPEGMIRLKGVHGSISRAELAIPFLRLHLS
ncbi:MAG: alkaline phosphatase family protein [Actinomycetaceae bacterium]|nr:alkaline phosphatase family protein [Actinomycetaceae bacterium]